MSSPIRLRQGLTALSLMLAAGLLVSACSSSSSSPTSGASSQSTGSTSSSGSTPVAAPSTSASPTVAATKPVHIRLLNGDGADYGVGMPVIAYFSKKITNAKPLQAATTVTVNGTAAKGAWYFEYSSASKQYPIEGHYRLQNYWPANSKIHIGIPAEKLSAGAGLSYDDSLTLDFSTHDRIISTVDDSTHEMTVVDNGKKYGTFPVSLGASSTPTRRGTKVIMEKGRDISMTGPGYYDAHVKYTQRLTYGGEYLHSAPWNHHLGQYDSSNGCTNLSPAVAQQLYGFLNVGDVVNYPNANGPAMRLGDGYGDWNVSWSQWQTGGLVTT